MKRLSRFAAYLSLRQQVVLFAALALAIILATLSVIGVRAARQVSARALEERLTTARSLATAADHELEELTRRLRLAAVGYVLDFQDGAPGPEREVTERAYRYLAPAATAVALLDAQGVVREVAGEALYSQGEDLSAWGSVRKALAGDTPQIVFRSEDGYAHLVDAVPGPGGAAGLLMAHLDLGGEPLRELLSLAPAAPAHLTIIDNTGVILASSLEAGLFQTIAHPEAGRASVQGLIAFGKPATGTCYSCHARKRIPEVMALAPLKEAPWAVVIREPEATFYAPVNRLRRDFVIAGAGAFVISLALAAAGMSLLTHRLGILAAATRRLARGDLGTPAPALGRDEVGALSRDFEGMRRELKAAWDEMEERIKERTAHLEWRTRELEALYAIDQAAVRKERQEEVLEVALAETLAALGSEAGTIFLAREGDVLDLVIHRGHSEESLRSLQRRQLGEGVVGQAALQRRALGTDLAHHPAPESVAAMRGEGFLHFAAAPLLIGERLVGVVATGRRQDTPFSQDDLNLLQSAANQVAISLERFRLLRELEHRSERRAAINRIARAVASSLDLEEIYDNLATELRRVLPFDRLSIALLTPEGNAVTLLQPGTPVLRMPERQGLDESPLGQVIRQGQHHIGNLEQEPGYARTPLLRAMGLRTSIMVPLAAKGKVLGALNLFSREVGRYSEADLELLQPIADHLALTLAHARLYRETTESVRRLEFLSEKLSERHAELQGAYQSMASSLVAILEARDPYTRGHSDRVRHYCRRIAIRLGLPREEVAVLEQAAQLHDLAKIGVPDSVLAKKGPLEPPEMAQVRLHPEKTVELLRLLPFLQEALPVIKHHHERWDGTGYPDGLAREAIPLGARIMAVADAYDAVTSDRPYRAALSHAGALAELERGAGTAWDTQVVQAFLQVLQEERTDPGG